MYVHIHVCMYVHVYVATFVSIEYIDSTFALYSVHYPGYVILYLN